QIRVSQTLGGLSIVFNTGGPSADIDNWHRTTEQHRSPPLLRDRVKLLLLPKYPYTSTKKGEGRFERAQSLFGSSSARPLFACYSAARAGAAASRNTASAAAATRVPAKKRGFWRPNSRTTLANVKSRKSTAVASPSSTIS